MALTNKALVLGHAKFGIETDNNYTHKLQQDMSTITNMVTMQNA